MGKVDSGTDVDAVRDHRGVDELIALAKDAQSRTSDGQSRLGSEGEALTGSRETRRSLSSWARNCNRMRERLDSRRIIEATAQIGGSDVVEKLQKLIRGCKCPNTAKSGTSVGTHRNARGDSTPYRRLNKEKGSRNRGRRRTAGTEKHRGSARPVNNSDDIKKIIDIIRKK